MGTLVTFSERYPPPAALPWYGSHFPFNLYLFHFGAALQGSEAPWEMEGWGGATLIVQNLKALAGPCQSWWGFLSIRHELVISMGLASCSACQCKHRPLCFSPQLLSHSPPPPIPVRSIVCACACVYVTS